jgi:hypothetical protein
LSSFFAKKLDKKTGSSAALFYPRTFQGFSCGKKPMGKEQVSRQNIGFEAIEKPENLYPIPPVLRQYAIAGLRF